MESKSISCSVCKVMFSNSSNLRKHSRKYHPDQFELIFGSRSRSVNVSETDFADKLVCCDCKKKFSKYSNLRIHVKKFHQGKLDLLAPKKTYNHRCNECGKQFTHLIKFKRHQKLHKPITTEANDKLRKSRFKCPLCSHKDLFNKAILQHFQTIHDIKIESECIEFSTLEEFKSWKNEIEKSTNAFYTILYSKKECVESINSKYVCHRSGSYTPKGNGLRHIKTQGTSKIGGFCPANLLVKSKDGKYLVQYTKTHVGHQMDLGHITLTTLERKEIATKIAAKIPLSDILNDIRDSLSNCNLERIHLLTKKDLYNIEKQFNLDACKHRNDLLSVEAWIKEMNNDVLLYKAQDSVDPLYPTLKSGDFVLIIMTDGQKDMLDKYCHDCICIDGTHGLNSYGFELTTLLIINQIREGFPCAFLLSNRSDEEVFSLFFSQIMEALGRKIKPRIFMSDMAEAFYNAWLKIMIPAEFRLYCTWHIDRAWRKNLSKINNKEKQIVVYKNLRILLQETDKIAFKNLIDSFLTSLMNDEDTKEFGLYFESHYIKRVKNWAYCYRVHSGLNTNMHIERMHRTIKYIYLHGKCVKRLDKAIIAIMKFVRDKLYDTLIIAYKGKLCVKLKNIRDRHKSSQQLDLNSVMKSDLGWEVLSSSKNEIYAVEAGSKNNCECKLKCSECDTCIHQYTCSCLDSSIKWNMCKHIHLVSRYIKSHSDLTDQHFGLEIENADESNLYIHQQPSESDNNKVIDSLSKKKTDKDLSVEKEKLMASLTNTINRITSFKGLDAIKNIAASMNPVLDAVQNQIGHRTLPQDSNLTPQNKKIEPQKRFYKKKKTQKRKPLIQKPSEDNVLAVQLMYSHNH